MAEIILIPAVAQPTNAFRVLDWIQMNLQNHNYTHFRFATAFAKVKPFLKLDSSFQQWKRNGHIVEAVFGIDHKGTSYQALSYSLNTFHHTYLVHADYSTFHPKIYLFYGSKHASIYYGSNNFTPGGLETNFEGGVCINLSIQEDHELFKQSISAFESLLPHELPCCLELTEKILSDLLVNNYLLDEENEHRNKPSVGTTSTGKNPNVLRGIFGEYKVKPAQAIPKAAVERVRDTQSAKIGLSTGTSTPKVTPVMLINGLVIQIIPHHNGEILLSKLAINQNPDFFGYPFTGHTVPKFATNPSYPQRTPDPIVNIHIFNNSGKLIREVLGYNLNTVYYATKSEIRITITPEILQHVPEYSIMVMMNSVNASYDYDLSFYVPGSTEYNDYLAVCNQTLPSGGKPVSRRMGWI